MAAAARISNRLLAAYHRVTITILVICLIGSVVAYTVYFVLTGAGLKSVIEEILSVLGITLAQAGLVGLALNRATVNEQTLQTQQLVERALDDVLAPLRPQLTEDSQEDYGWHAVLSAPDQADTHQDFARLSVTLISTLGALPSELRAICLASANENVLAPFAGDDKYFLRWVVRPQLSPQSRAVFDIEYLSIDGVVVEGTWRNVDGGAEWRASVPRHLRDDSRPHTISVRYLVRKRIGQDRRATIRSQLFKLTTGTSFSCTVDSSFGFSSLASYYSEVSPLSREAIPFGVLETAGTGPLQVNLSYDVPLQRGSAVSFELERN